MIDIKYLSPEEYNHKTHDFEEEYIKEISSYHTTVKDVFRVYFYAVDFGYSKAIYMSVYYLTNRRIYDLSDYLNGESKLTSDDVINNLLQNAAATLFTDEEICSPCKTMAEYRKREQYLCDYYIGQVINAIYGPIYSTNFDKRYVCPIYDPISYRYVQLKDRDFVNHHVWLAMQLKKTIKPTIFLENYAQLGRMEKAATYLTCIHYAAHDDPMLDEVIDYLKTYGGQIAKEAYAMKLNELVCDLVCGGYVKTPTLKKLLEMANENDDAKLAALIMERMKDKQASARRFAL